MRSNVPTSAVFAVVCLICVALSGTAHASPYTDYSEHVLNQNYPAALEVARKIIKRPNLVLSITKDKTYLIQVRIIGLQALGYYSEHIALEPGMTDEAQRYYNEALDFAGDDAGLKARVHYEMAVFYSSSGQPGLAVPLMSKTAEIYETRHDTYNLIKTYLGWSALYADMGEKALSDHFEKKWLAIAEKFFVLGRRPKDEDKWLIYYDALERYAAGLSVPSHAAQLNKAWETMSAIADNHPVPKASHYLSGAKIFALAGEHQIATELLKQAVQESEILASQIAQEAGSTTLDLYESLMKTDLICARAQIEHEAGMNDEALVNGRECEQRWESSEMDMGPGTHIVLGEIYEASDDYLNAIRSYQLSIKSTEGIRASFNISDRAAFFTNPVIQSPYWGLIRVSAKQALQEDSIENFHEVLKAKEQIRARQFGEMTGSGDTSGAAFAAIQQRLNTNSALLDYVLTDKDIVLTLFSRNDRMVAVIPFDRGEFRKRILTITRQLSDPNSDSDALETALHQISQTLLANVLPFIAGKEQLIVITDGELNLVPFGLWSIGTTNYEPLVDVASIRYVPSLRSLSGALAVESVGTQGLFALGDPIYGDTSMIAGLPSSELEEATRGANLQAYFAPLPETRTEVENISKLFPGQANELLIGARAVESLVKGADLSRYRYVHFATHGILGGEVPGIGEPALVLGGETDEDGFLKASEAEQLRLNDQLTALSACNTGSGEFVQGEGVMGLSRAFLLAGSESVLVSLWPVASEATEDLMLGFYKYMQNGERPYTALRHAKIDIRHELRNPYFWAPFILITQN